MAPLSNSELVGFWRGMESYEIRSNGLVLLIRCSVAFSVDGK
jgi:hypothetical protein